MKSIKAIIVDDEFASREVLQTLIQQYNGFIEVIATCIDLLEAVEKIKELQPNVVFLDVQMPNYAGYEIANFFDEINFEIIFVTAHDQYAIKAFELNAIDYLVKPVERKRLKQTVERLQNHFIQETEIQDYKRLLNTIKNDSFEKIVISESGKRHKFKLSEIIAFQASGSYCKIILADDTSEITHTSEITVSKNLKYFENLLKENLNFFRTHRAWLINISYFLYLQRTSLEVILEHQVKAKISRNKLEEFEEIV